MDFVLNLKGSSVYDSDSRIEMIDYQDDDDNDYLCDLPDEDAVLLVQFHGTKSENNKKSSMVKSFSIPKSIASKSSSKKKICSDDVKVGANTTKKQ